MIPISTLSCKNIKLLINLFYYNYANYPEEAYYITEHRVRNKRLRS